MPKKVLALMLFFAVFAAAVVAADAVGGSDSASANAFSSPPEFMAGPESFGPGPSDVPPSGERRGMPVDDRFERMPERPPMGADMPMDEPRHLMPPDSREPMYNHDATPEDFERMIPVMVEEDISLFDAGFVKDAIDYAKDNGMKDVADVLQSKLSEYLSIFRLANCLNSADLRSTGSVDEDEEESEIVYLEDEEEEDDPVLPSLVDEKPVLYSFKPVSSPVQVNLQLDL